MRTIWKYEIAFAGEISVPKGSEFLTADIQDELFCAWFLVDSEAEKEAREFYIHGTGHEIGPNEKYLGTFQQPPFVWHLFEVTP